MIGKLDRAKAVENLRAAVAYLKSRTDSNGKVGAVGFCWGGGMTDLLAANEPTLAAAAPFYGPVPPPDQAKNIKAKLLLHYAENDNFVNPGVAGFEATLKSAGVSYTKYVYPGTQHAFHNDTAGARYNKEAAELAWSRTLAFFKETLG